MNDELSIATETTVSPAEGTPEAAKPETKTEGEQSQDGKTEAEAKPEKTPEQREIERLRRGLNRKHEQAARATERAAMFERQLTGGQNAVNSDPSDTEPLQLTRAQIRELVNAEAQRLAPIIQDRASEQQRYASVQEKLESAWDSEKFQQMSDDLDAAFGGLDNQGKLKPAIEAAFESDNPTALLEYLADPDHHDEARKLARMSPIQAGREIARLEMKLSKPAAQERSKAPAPLEPLRGGSVAVVPDESKMSDAEWERYRESKRGK